MTKTTTQLTAAVETYFADLRRMRASGGATGERSSYGPLASLLNAVGGALKPKVFCVVELADQGAGHPDVGLYSAKQLQKGRPKEGQTLFYGVFSAWVLWARQRPPPTGRFNWHEAVWHLRAPALRALFQQLSDPGRLQPLGLVEVLDWAAAALDRVDRALTDDLGIADDLVCTSQAALFRLTRLVFGTLTCQGDGFTQEGGY